ncbi:MULTISPECIES: hypothetical protein [unclassified Pedobacter]|uniref:hypothetical protein n=1 Tax=unclassified Pedobacter TaxID=2628915 RepID=UPI001E659B19|nr:MULTISPECIES: hypothetical protein [unclassified Pedobacter]
MSNSEKKTLMVFKITSEKFLELRKYVDCDKRSLTIFSPGHKISSGAVFLDKTSLEAMFEEFENAS